MAKEATQEPSYETIALSGFVSKTDNLAEPYAFSKLFERVRPHH